MNKSVKVIYWASAELKFMEILKEICSSGELELDVAKLTHHPSWLKQKTLLSFFINLIFLFNKFAKLIYYSRNAKIIVFGTNAVRIIFPFIKNKKLYLVYNELPSFKWPLLNYYDKFIFNSSANLFVSSESRRRFLKKRLEVIKEIGILSNLPSLVSCPENKDRKGVIYSGLISKDRLLSHLENLEELSKLTGKRIDAYGFLSERVNFPSFIDYRGNLDHTSLLRTLNQYEYGLLSYSQEDFNNEYCAPIKIYEYVASGCTPISIGNNLGLKDINEKYPGLIIFISEIGQKDSLRSMNKESAIRFLRDALIDNENFVKYVLQKKE